jgi:hypothetical protein
MFCLMYDVTAIATQASFLLSLWLSQMLDCSAGRHSLRGSNLYTCQACLCKVVCLHQVLVHDTTCCILLLGWLQLQGGQRRGLDLDDDLDLGPEPSSLVTVAPGATSHAGGTQAAASGRLPPGAFAHPGGVAHGGSTGSTAASSSAFKRYSINGYVDPVELLGLEVFAAVAAAVPEAVAGGVLQLWRHMHRLPGAAPSEALLQLMAATTATAVAAGEWLSALVPLCTTVSLTVTSARCLRMFTVPSQGHVVRSIPSIVLALGAHLCTVATCYGAESHPAAV